MLENLEDGEGSTRALVFGVLTEMMKQVGSRRESRNSGSRIRIRNRSSRMTLPLQESLQPGFHGFTELVILKVLQAHKDQVQIVIIAR